MENGFQKTVVVLGSLMVLVQILTVLVLRTSFRQDHLKIFDTAVALLNIRRLRKRISAVLHEVPQ